MNPSTAAANDLVAASLAELERTPFWLDRPDRPVARPPLEGPVDADLVVVGGGYGGLWTALLAKERHPDREVVLVEAERIGWAASGRNGGFCAASLTHGEANGRTRWPQEYELLARLGLENLDAIEAAIDRYGIDCAFERTGELTVATAEHQIAELVVPPTRGEAVTILDREAVQAEVASPTYLAGRWDTRGTALVDPARLAWGLTDACESVGVRIFEGTPVTALASHPLAVVTPHGTLRPRQVALATNVFPSLVRRLRLHTVPVWDYALMTEPLSAEQLEAIGWRNRQGIGDSANQFHYYRRTEDDRILWGGYDAIYHYGKALRPEHEHRQATYETLAGHFFATFPQLEGLRFTHGWGGAIDTCTRFCAFFDLSHGGQVASTAGYTGLGVGATRFGAEVMLDLLEGRRTERTQLELVRRKPLPFPPEPIAWAGIQLTRRAMARADADGGRRNLWLRAMDSLGLGFDS